jgi:hypothetical protein
MKITSVNSTAYCEHYSSNKLLITFSRNLLRILAKSPPPLTWAFVVFLVLTRLTPSERPLTFPSQPYAFIFSFFRRYTTYKVGGPFLYIIQLTICSQCHSPERHEAQPQVTYRVATSEICGSRIGTGAGFSHSFCSSSLLSTSSCHHPQKCATVLSRQHTITSLAFYLEASYLNEHLAVRKVRKFVLIIP